MKIYKLKNISYKYPTSKDYVLSDLNVEFEENKIHIIIGANNSGKTSFCSMLRGFIPHFYKGEFKGSLEFNDQNLDENMFNMFSKDVGYIFQNPFTQITYAANTVYEEIAFGMENMAVAPEIMKERIVEVAELLGITHLLENNPINLSGGQRQKVAIASMVAMDQPVYIFDEPTSQLDPQATKDVLKVIEHLQAKGKTVFLAEHKIEDIFEMADTITIIHNGTIGAHSEPNKLLLNGDFSKFNIPIPEHINFTKLLIEKGYELPLECSKEKSINNIKQLGIKWKN